MESGRDLLLPPVSEENVCLPLAVNAVARYWDVELPMDVAAEIARKYQNVDGSILIEGVELAERHNLECFILHSSLDALKDALDHDVPPIVILPGIQNTIQHASVISGYDPVEDTIMHYIPQTSSEDEHQVGIIPSNKFDEMWSEDDRLMILIAPGRMIAGMDLPDRRLLKSNRLCFESERLTLLGKSGDAIASLREAIRLDESNSTAHIMLAGALNVQGSPECVAHYNAGMRQNSRSYMAYRGLGNYYLKIKQYSRAEDCYTRAISINANRYGPIYKNRGIVRLQQDNKEGARRDLQTYLKQTPKAADGPSIRAALREL